MIDRPRELNAHDSAMHLPPSPDPTPPSPEPNPPALDNFNTISRWSISYDEYYGGSLQTNGGAFIESDIAASTNVYHNLVAECEPRETSSVYRYMMEWTETETTSWLADFVRRHGLNEYSFPFWNFRIPGFALRGLKREEIIERLRSQGNDAASTGDLLFDAIQYRLSEEATSIQSMQYYVDPYDPHPYQEPQMINLDDIDNRNKSYVPEYYTDERQPYPNSGDSSDNTEEYRRSPASPELSYKSDGTDDEIKNGKVFKRPPGRPRGSGRRNMTKRTKGPSVPEFLVSLLLSAEYCPVFVQWVDYNAGKFRFNKPDAVAKLWGMQKQNPNMTFEKFSRAMRYHYKQMVLLPEPSARLVYRFGPKAPNYKTDNPNFANVKPEIKSEVFSNYKTATVSV